MAGGNFTTQTKVRPGAYINFKAVKKPASDIAVRGIVALALALGWGPQETIMEIYSEDLINGGLYKKLGYRGNEPEVQSIREALKNSYKLLLYRVDKGGQKASANVTPLNVIAKYPGVVGNRISVIITAIAKSGFSVKTLLDGVVVDEQTATTVAELVSNDWVDFSGEGDLVASVGTQLEGGEDGNIAAGNYTKLFTDLRARVFNTLGIYTTESTVKTAAVELVKELRDSKGKKVQAVINECAADYEGIISVDQGYKTLDETVNVDGFVAYVAGLTAATGVNKSNTYHLIPNAIEIIKPKLDEELEQGIKDGKLMLSYRSDESVVIEADINTLVTLGDDKDESFRKNRTIRTLDDIANKTKEDFENNFLGKVNNDEMGREMYKSNLLSYLSELNKLGAIEQVAPEDITVVQGTSKDSVVVTYGITTIDSMEKLYMTVTVQ